MITQRGIFKESTRYGLAVSKTREAVQVSSKSDRRLNDASFEENSNARRQLKVFIAGVAPIKKYLERGRHMLRLVLCED